MSSKTGSIKFIDQIYSQIANSKIVPLKNDVCLKDKETKTEKMYYFENKMMFEEAQRKIKSNLKIIKTKKKEIKNRNKKIKENTEKIKEIQESIKQRDYKIKFLEENKIKISQILEKIEDLKKTKGDDNIVIEEDFSSDEITLIKKYVNFMNHN